jgi:hypothetical protein
MLHPAFYPILLVSLVYESPVHKSSGRDFKLWIHNLKKIFRLVKEPED